MRFAILLFFLMTQIYAFAQPGNDDCNGLIDLGALPACTNEIYTNVGATASNIGVGNVPLCFNGGTTQNDVWFSFTTTNEITDVSISVIGNLTGPNSQTIINPQIALYRGACQVNGLAELACATSDDGDAQVTLDIAGLIPGFTYFVRVNDFSATATPNSGDFTICVDEFDPVINMGGEVTEATTCFGTLFDSGGPDADYSSAEDNTFTICPSDPHQCIELDFEFFNIENNFDELLVFAGADATAPQIARITGVDNGNGFTVQASSSCVTLVFSSDGSLAAPGFEMNWSCSPLECDGSSTDNPTVISSLPFSDSFSTCDGAATFNQSPCTGSAFLNGPDYVLEFQSNGGICGNIEISGAEDGTGIAVYNGLPDDPNTLCVGTSTSEVLNGVSFEDPGTYYIVVANSQGCTDFDISITQGDCPLSPSLVDALCNPLNGCIEISGLPSIFNFQDGFQDWDLVEGVNAGCWTGFGVEPDLYWFTIEAQENGPFGFILESADNPSDIDFNVWGPFTQEQVCETPQAVVNLVNTTQPIRSSWSGEAVPTGLVDINPNTGEPVTDAYDCGDPSTPGAGGDDFVSTIPAQTGEVYVVLVNDWGNQIAGGGISVDWSPSQADVLAPIEPEVIAGDTAICAGQSAQIIVGSGFDDIVWINNTESLSCTTCLDPIASPNETTTYTAILNAVCFSDTIDVTVTVFTVDAGPDVTVCRGEEIQIVAGSNFEDAAYEWNVPADVQLSCTDCPDPIISSTVVGTYTLSVTLITPDCTLEDEMELTIFNGTAPNFEIADDAQICEGESFSLGGTTNEQVTWSWVSLPPGFTSSEPNPTVTPTETTKYFVEVAGLDCPFPSFDSVLVEVFALPVVDIASDTMDLCQGEPITLGNTTLEDDVTYSWTGPNDIEDTSNPNTVANPQMSGTYTLTASRGACQAVESLNVEIIEIDIELIGVGDTLLTCLDEPVELAVNVVPADATVSWLPDNGTLSALEGTSVELTPRFSTTYFASVAVPGCAKTDSVFVVVDSLPADLSIMPADTMICQGELVILTSTTFEPFEFPNIEFMWIPPSGQQSPDSLYNLVAQPDETTLYQRITTSGACVDTSSANVTVIPTAVLTVIPTDTTICQGESVQFQLEGPNPLEEIEWMPEDGLSCTDCPNPIATPGATTQYMISAEFDGCPISASATINVDLLPQFNVSPQAEICLGQSIRLNPIDDGISTYTWTSPDDPDFLSNDPRLEVSPTQNQTFNLEATNECGTLTASILVIVVQPSIATVDAPVGPFCSNETVTFTATTNAASGVSETFTWTVSNGSSGTGPTFSFVPSPGTNTVEFTYTYGPNCGTETATFTVEASEGPSVDIIQDTTICLGETALLNPNASGNTNYTWTAVEDPNFSSNDPNPAVSPTVTTTYQVTGTTPGCPESTAEVTVTVVQPATVSIDGPSEICANESATFTATTTAGAGVAESFTWRLGSVEIGNEASVTFEPGIGTNVVTLEYTYGPACETITVSATLEAFEPPVANIALDTLVCSGTSIALNPNADVNTNYVWTATPDDPTLNTTDPNPVVTPTTTTTYEVTASTPGCPDDIASVVVTIPVVEDIIIEDVTFCQVDTTQTITATFVPERPLGVTETFQWTVGGEVRSMEESVVVSGNDIGQQVELIYTFGDSEGVCSELDDNAAILEGETPIVELVLAFEGETEPLENGAIVATESKLQLVPIINGLQAPNLPEGVYTLNTGLGDILTLSANDFPFIFSASENVGTFTASLNYMNPEGCDNGAQVSYETATATVEIPNAFTPNNDDLNDTFKVYTNDNDLDIQEFVVFNRWGEKVYEGVDADGWDGMIDGNPAPSDVYVYFLKYKFSFDGTDIAPRMKQGDVTLLR